MTTSHSLAYLYDHGRIDELLARLPGNPIPVPIDERTPEECACIQCGARHTVIGYTAFCSDRCRERWHIDNYPAQIRQPIHGWGYITPPERLVKNKRL